MAFLLANAKNLGIGKLFKKGEEQAPVQNQAPAVTNTPHGTASFAGTLVGFTDKQAHYEDVSWSRLPLSAKKAAKVIGYDEQTWNNKEWLDIEDYWWDDLSAERRTACETLGWDMNSWDSKYEGTSWSNLPTHVQRAAEKLGWNKEQWDDEKDGTGWENWEKEWSMFTPEEQRCYHVLGYYVHTWG
jgi:hypothetical protein